MHTYIRMVSGVKICYWSMGDVYYVEEDGDWVIESKDIHKVEEFILGRINVQQRGLNPS
ncbi:hypothetical protein J2T17_006348 [Paenibacillus mucilaginosus]